MPQSSGCGLIFSNRENHSSNLFYDVYFRIEAGYNDGRMSHEQHDRFYTEIRALFSRAGFTILENPPGCPSFQWGTTCFYCHPTELSGPVEERHFLAAFRTSVPSKYHLRDEVLEELVRQLMVHTVRALLGCSFDSPCVHFVRETYASLVQRGLLVEIQRKEPYGTMFYCRTK